MIREIWKKERKKDMIREIWKKERYDKGNLKERKNDMKGNLKERKKERKIW